MQYISGFILVMILLLSMKNLIVWTYVMLSYNNIPMYVHCLVERVLDKVLIISSKEHTWTESCGYEEYAWIVIYQKYQVPYF